MSSVKTAMDYSRLVDICTGFGGKYNPGRQTLQLKAMRALLKEAQSSLQDVSQKTNAYKTITNERELAFAEVRPLASKVIFTLKALAMPAQTIEDARYFLRMIQGRMKSQRPAVPAADADQSPVIARRFTQQSYVAVAANFQSLVNLVAQLPDYVTNEPELTVDQLQVKATLLHTMNDRVSKATVDRRNAIRVRNKVLYENAVSLVDNASRVKSYIRVLYGPRSAEFDQVKVLSFTKPQLR